MADNASDVSGDEHQLKPAIKKPSSQPINTTDVEASKRLEKMGPNDLTPLTPELIAGQATINIGTIGHVAHGKSTVVKALSGVQTVRFKNELERNITIKLGYANAKIFKCSNEACPRPSCYKAYPSSKEAHPLCERDGCGGIYNLVRHVSFVDCPGHDILMSTMLSGAAVMDGAMLLIAGNESCPQPQTSEHLAAIEIMKLKNVIVLQNKVDLLTAEAAAEHQKSIVNFIRGTVAEGSGVIPLSAQLGLNTDAVAQALAEQIPVPKRSFDVDPLMMIVRSFDVNKPGAEIDELKGGVAGGSIIQGVLRLGDEVEIRPGLVERDSKGKFKCTPIITTIFSLNSENNSLPLAGPGGLIGIGSRIDPTLCRADRLVGNLLGKRGSLPDMYADIEISFSLLRRLLGVQAANGKSAKVVKLTKNEVLMVNIGARATGGKVVAVRQDAAKLSLTTPVCANIGDKIALSRRIEKHWRLIGYGTIVNGGMIEPSEYKTDGSFTPSSIGQEGPAEDSGSDDDKSDAE